MTAEQPVQSPAPTGRKDKAKQYAKRFGVAGFLFFLIKGLLWLLIPLAIAMGWFGK